MEDFRKHALNTLAQLPEKESELLSEDWRILLLLPKLHRLVQDKMFTVFSRGALQAIEQKRGLDYGFLIEEILLALQGQEQWLDELGALCQSEYLISNTQQQLRTIKGQLSKKNKSLSTFLPKFQELEKTVKELEEQTEKLELLKAAEGRLRNRKKELEAFQKWVKDNKLEQLEKEVETLEKEYQPLEAKRQGLASKLERMIREKDKRSFEVERLLRIEKRLEGANRMLEEWAPAIRAYNEKVIQELEDEKETLMIHFQENHTIATELNAPSNLKDQLEDIQAQLRETDDKLAWQIEENTDKVYAE
ncbi:MAG: hypothetical protein H6566_24605 [Lewinellaceae bacterium]|nr:hypothetical protein [Lewinellaceae bacterium]